ncbi:MAG: chloride channel protein [Cyclobacteriaceae bacterium]|nr:chloride channel protein [Cyclobacteriaceae bacterium]MDH5248575.1 chloride channel protein [Cyclobacteriaceae bacterium]
MFVKEFATIHWMGLQPGEPGGEVAEHFFSVGAFNPYLIVLVPAIGGLITGFIVYKFAPEAEGHGTDEAIKAFHKKRGIIRPIVPIVKLFASAITIGTGGSGGREGPIAQIGAGFGSFLGQRLGLNAQTRRWLLAAGMGAGIGSIFRAPLAGAIFAAEVLYSSMEVETEVLLPATVSSIIAYSVYSFSFGWDHIFTNVEQHGFSNPLELIPYSIEALVLAFAALIFVKSFYGVRNLFAKWSIPAYIKPVLGGLITGTVALLLIQLTGDRKFVIDVLGGGYGILQEIFQNGLLNVSLLILALVAVGKIITTSFTIGSGGSAGVFGPSMVIGGTVGAATGYILQLIFPGIPIHPSTFAIVGMAGFFSAAANTPLSTIIMVSELTGNYSLLLPSMWVCTLAYLVARRWSIYKSQVPGKAYSQAHFGEYSYDIFETTLVEEAFRKERNYVTIPSTTTLDEIVKRAANIRQHIFPVTDNDGHLIGSFTTPDLTQALMETGGATRTAVDIMSGAWLRVMPRETMRKAQQIMMDNQVEELLVVDAHELPAKTLGIITTADLLTAYNSKFAQMKFGNAKPETALPEDTSVLGRITLSDVLERDLITIEPEATLGDLVKIIIRSKRNIFPVVDKRLKYYGIILLNDVREIMFDNKLYETTLVKDLMVKSPDTIIIDEGMNEVMKKFEQTNAWNLPVVDRYKRYRGLISKSNIFSAYRNQLLVQAG